MSIKIKTTALHKAFGSKQVLRGVDIEVESGKSLVVIGGSGTGKSVLLKSIIGLMKADSGSIMIDGQEMARARPRLRSRVMEKFGYLFQGGALFDSLNVWENITFGVRQYHKMNTQQARDLAVAKLESVGLGADVATLYPSELSGGMQKRVSLARTIAGNPEIIFFDEPTTGLDPIMSGVINELIVKCSKDLGATTITITHDMTSCRHIADHVAMLHQGSIIWHGEVAEMDNTDNEIMHNFITGTASDDSRAAA